MILGRYRDPNIDVPLTEITRFPHAVLEIKLQLESEDQTPAWVTEMLSSGMLEEVHKFSKFIHGCAVLLPEEVQSVPYWIDDVTLSHSIRESGATLLLESSEGANKVYSHLLPHDQSGQSKAGLRARPQLDQNRVRALNLETVGKNAKISEEDDEEDGRRCLPRFCDYATAWESDRITTQKVF